MSTLPELPQGILTKPVYLGNAEKTRKIELGPITTFVCTNPVGQTIAEVDVPQYSFLEETVTSLPVIFYQAIGQKVCYDFRHLIGVNIRKDVACAWAAFEIMIKWLNTGIYQNDEKEATHIDAYFLAEKLQSPRFGNAVMQCLLAQMPPMKTSGDMADTMRRCFDEGEEFSLLRKLMFDAVVWWFPPGDYLMGTRTPGYFEGAGLLYGNDKYWLKDVEEYRRETCQCPPSKRRKSSNNSSSSGMRQDVCDACRREPWLDEPRRYYHN